MLAVVVAVFSFVFVGCGDCVVEETVEESCERDPDTGSYTCFLYRHVETCDGDGYPVCIVGYYCPPRWRY